MSTPSFFTKHPTFSHDQFTQCVQWAMKMERAVTEGRDPPMERAPALYDIYRDHNTAAIDPVYAKTLQQQHRQKQNLLEIRELSGGAPSSNDTVSLRALELVVDTIRDVQVSHNTALTATFRALQAGAATPSPPADNSRARQRDRRREMHQEQRNGSSHRPQRRDGNHGRPERAYQPDRSREHGVRMALPHRRSASPPRVSRPRPVSPQYRVHKRRPERRPDTPFPREGQASHAQADTDYDGDQEMEDAFRASPAPRAPSPRPGEPAQPPQLGEPAQPPQLGEPAQPPPPDESVPSTTSGTDVARLPEQPLPVMAAPVAAAPLPFAAAGEPRRPSFSHPFNPVFENMLPPFPPHHHNAPPPASQFQMPFQPRRPPFDAVSSSEAGPEGASAVASPSSTHQGAFANLPFAAAGPDYAQGVTDDFQGLALNPADLITDQYILIEPHLPLPI